MSRRAPALASLLGVMVLFLAGYWLLLAPVQQSFAATSAVTWEVDRLDDPTFPTGGSCTVALNDCSLRGAIGIASANDTIELTVPGTITLTQNQIRITKNLTITGISADVSAIDGNAADRIFIIEGSDTVQLAEMTLQNGRVENETGGAILMSTGTLTMAQVVLQNNQANAFDLAAPSAAGGALSLNVLNGTANLFLDNVTFRANEVGSSNFVGIVKGGAISISPGSDGIANITIEESLFEENSASMLGVPGPSGSGGAISIDPFGGRSEVTIRGSSFINNSAGGSGGAIFSAAQSEDAATLLTIRDTTFMSNTAAHEGGAIQNFSSGLNANATARIAHSTFAGNQATGYVFAGPISGGYGGAISNRVFYTDGVAALEAVNVTMSHNSAAQTGGAILTGGNYGDNNVIITNATLIGNDAENGNDIGHSSGIAVIYLRNSILASDEGNCSGTGLAITGENNLITGTSCGVGSPFRLGAPAGVFPTLADNGGPTWTHSFYAESNALNAVPAGGCTIGVSPTPLTVDQRGDARPFGVVCDIGALEVQNETLPAQFTPTPTPDFTLTPGLTPVPTLTPPTPTSTTDPSITATSTASPTATTDPAATATHTPLPNGTVAPTGTPSPFNSYLPSTIK